MFCSFALTAIAPQTSLADTAFSWGNNSYGQLGDSTTTQRNTPVPVSILSNSVTSVAAGGYQGQGLSLALQGGQVFAWGSNSNGQLGNGSTTDSSTPTPVSGLSSSVTSIAAGSYHSLAIQAGQAFAWGRNSNGQLGNGTTADSSTPTPVSGLSSGVTAIAAGSAHSLAIVNNAVYAWGHNDSGQVGDGSHTANFTSPVELPTLTSNVTSIAAGYSHSLAIMNGALYAWGYNDDGELGDSTNSARWSPTAITTLSSNVTAIAAGTYHSLAVQNGHVYAWGYNGQGELGNGTRTDSNTPTLVPGLADIVQVAASWESSYALAADGSLYAWGGNSSGQLGIDDSGEIALHTQWFPLTPTQVPAPAGYKFTSISSDTFGFDTLATLAPIPVPEPASLTLLALASTALLPRRRR